MIEQGILNRREECEARLTPFTEGTIMSVALSDEVAEVDLGDERLNKRLAKIIEELGGKPTMSIPAATEGRAEMEATYRFFDNPSVSPDKLLLPHRKATLERISQCDVVLLVQDTTELDLTRPKQQVQGAGPLSWESRRGTFFHPMLAFNSDGLPLGVAWQKNWSRDSIETELTPVEKERNRRGTPIEQKESIRWVEGLRAAREVAQDCPRTECVCVGDSEADIYEMFTDPRTTSHGEVHLLVRACQDRATTDSSQHWLQAVRATSCLFQCQVDVSGRSAKIESKKRKRREERKARIADVEVRATTLTLRPPYRCDRKLAEVTVNVVLVEESNPPDGETPIQWLLITTLPIETVEQVRRVIRYYAIRWQIEIYFRTIKSGCRVEERQFETLPRLLNCMAVYAIIAWKVMYLCRLGRVCPDLDCEIIFEPSEWKPVYMVLQKQAPPSVPPTLNEMIRMIAALGGYVLRSSTEPGPQTLWLGLQRVHDLSTAWTTFGPD